MDRQLLFTGVPVEIAWLISASIFDSRRVPQPAPVLTLPETAAFERIRAWIGEHQGRPVIRDEVEGLLSEIFGDDSRIYEEVGFQGRSEFASTDGIINIGLETSRALVPEIRSMLRHEETNQPSLMARFQSALNLQLSRRGTPRRRLRVRDPETFEGRLIGRIYEESFEALRRIGIFRDTPASERFTLELFIRVLWGWLQAHHPVSKATSPDEAIALIHPADSRCIRCGARLGEDGYLPDTESYGHYVRGLCFHELITKGEREILFASPVDGPEDLARRLLHVFSRFLPTSLESLSSPTPLPIRTGLLNEWIATEVSSTCGIDVTTEQVRASRSIGEIFELMLGELDPFPVSPYAEDHIVDLVKYPGETMARRAVSSQHEPSAVCLAGELIKLSDDIEAMRGRLATHINRIQLNRCPRCDGDLPESPLGSRVTTCSCIPVCSNCSADEVSNGVHLELWPIAARDRLVDEDVISQVFTEWPSFIVDPRPDEEVSRWSYGTWPSRILGRTMTVNSVWRGVGKERHIGDDATSAVRSRMLGCVLGGAIGDAIGAPVEFMRLDEITSIVGPTGMTGYWDRAPDSGSFTDDTQMTLWTIEGLIRTRQRWHGSDYNWWSPAKTVGGAYLRWLRTQGETFQSKQPRVDEEYVNTGWLLTVPRLHVKRAPGKTCLSALKGGRFGTVDDSVNDSKGCGGVMRVAPAGFVPFEDHAFVLGTSLAAITHGHPSGYLAGGAIAHIIARLNDGEDLGASVTSALDVLTEHAGHLEVSSALSKAVELALGGNPTPSKLESLGAGFVAEEALAIAVYSALVSDNFRHGVLLAVNHSGDSDSTGSIAGQILGTIHGVEGIPAEWLDSLRLGRLVETLTNDFVDAFYDDKVFNNDLYPPW